MGSNSEVPRDLADRVIRQALRHPANLRAFLHQVVPALASGFDCERGRFLDREFPMDDWRHREADLPSMADMGTGRRAEASAAIEPSAAIGVAHGTRAVAK